MAIVEAKVHEGTLKFGPLGTEFDFSCQVTNVRINSSYTDDGDQIETLCGDTVPPGRKLDARQIAGTFVQDWLDEALSITEYLWENDLQTQAFEYEPNPAAGGPTLTGSCRLEVPSESFGGNVNERITSDFEFAIIGDVTRTWPVLGATTAASTSKSKTKVDA